MKRGCTRLFYLFNEFFWIIINIWHFEIRLIISSFDTSKFRECIRKTIVLILDLKVRPFYDLL